MSLSKSVPSASLTRTMICLWCDFGKFLKSNSGSWRFFEYDSKDKLLSHISFWGSTSAHEKGLMLSNGTVSGLGNVSVRYW